MLFENLFQLKLNKMTKAQLEREKAAGNIEETGLYLTPDTSVSYEPQELTPEQQAQARANIGMAHAVEEELEKRAPIDFSGNVRLTQHYVGEYPDFTLTHFPTKEYIYMPALHMVFFNLEIVFTGKLRAGDIISVSFFQDDMDGHFFKPRGYTYPATSRTARFSAEHLPNEIAIKVNEAIDAEGLSDSIGLSGWYFCG